MRVKGGAARQGEMEKTVEEVYGRGEGTHAGSRRKRGVSTGKAKEMDEPLWSPLTTMAARRRGWLNA